MVTRVPAVAGAFYPADPDRLRLQLREYLAPVHPTGRRPKALIVPHAGYVYSGAVAARAFAQLEPFRGSICRVILLGPAHWVTVRGIFAPESETFRTPLVDVPVDVPAIDELEDLPQLRRLERAHGREHSLEVQLPFLQETLLDFRLVPLLVGDATTEELSELLERLWGGEETLVVVSSDLSHYLAYGEANEMDRATRGAIERLDAGGIGPEQACGRTPLAGLLATARARRMRITTLDLRNSGDTAGDRSRVVGYGAWMLEEPV